jgi:Bacterial dipeptidyl-peptidase Sh3 domain/NlpC/P60 family
VTRLDPRLHPARPDLAARHLQGSVQAARFVEGKRYEVLDAQAPVRDAPAPDATLQTEALMGEPVMIYEMTEEGFAWGQLEIDGYVGWLPANALGAPGAAPTHRVSALRTFVFPGPSFKLPPLAPPPLGARLAIVREQERFAVTAAGGFVPANHLVPLGSFESDFVAVAERFCGAPYLWGGKTSLGLDCSGLLQISLQVCGIPAPRDTDLQEQALGTAIETDASFANLRRGDLLFWPGHMAIARDPETLVHANAFHMMVAIEPIAEAIARIRAAGSELKSVKRFSL